jgi:hypothetical protein
VVFKDFAQDALDPIEEGLIRFGVDGWVRLVVAIVIATILVQNATILVQPVRVVLCKVIFKLEVGTRQHFLVGDTRKHFLDVFLAVSMLSFIR